jgi:hypothetical protein
MPKFGPSGLRKWRIRFLGSAELIGGCGAMQSPVVPTNYLLEVSKRIYM